MPNGWLSCLEGPAILNAGQEQPGHAGNNHLGGSNYASFDCVGGRPGRCAAMSSSVFAQVPADPANPNEAVPDAVNVVPYGETINLADAKKAAEAAAAEAPTQLERRFALASWRRPEILCTS